MAVRIHQIFYDVAQRPALDPAFAPYDNTTNPEPEWREYHVFQTAWLAGMCRPGDVTGFVSWKFTSKTGVPGRDFLAFIDRHPGHDVYFLHPHRVEPRPFTNIWQQAEVHHPGIIGLAQRIFDAIGEPVDLAALEQPREQVLFCNYWAGSHGFWQAYMDLAGRVARQIREGLDEADRRLAWSRADRLIDAPYVPFIMERLFSTLLATRAGIRFCAWDERKSKPTRTGWARRLFGRRRHRAA